jgi:hypothetical protein
VPGYASLDALNALIASLPASTARRRQLGMLRRELAGALARNALPVPARRSLRRLLQEDALDPYVRLAESGALRTRLVGGQRPPTSAMTNRARLDCLDVLREAVGLPRVRLGSGAAELRPIPAAGQLAQLRRQLDQDLAGYLSPGRTRFTAVVAIVLDTAAASGELVAQRATDLDDDHSSVKLDRRPRHGVAAPEGGRFGLSPLGQAALGGWLPVRTDFVSRAHGTTRLWVSLHPNHDGVLDDEGRATLRPAGMPLEENGLITSYRRGREQYGLQRLLPPQLSQLRRAVEAEQAAARR